MTHIRVFKHRGHWLTHSRRDDGTQDYAVAGVPDEWPPERVAEEVASCNPGCDVEIDEERCGG